MSEEKICLGCGIHIFPGMSHFCKKDGDEEFLKPIRDKFKKLQNAERLVKAIITMNLRTITNFYPNLPKDLPEAMAFHIYKGLSQEEIAWALQEIAQRKETEEKLSGKFWE